MSEYVCKVIFVGSNPSEAGRPFRAFDASTRSGRMLLQWMHAVDLNMGWAMNIYDHPTPNNRALTDREIRGCLNGVKQKIGERVGRSGPQKIVALGKSAAKALRMLEIEFLELPHPSGLNRKLNDKAYVESMLNQLKEYIRDDKAHLIHF